MRIAVVSDIHGNLTAFEAVLDDLRNSAPDLVLHGGDLADSGSSPVEIVDRIVTLGWPGVAGNTDELLFRPQSLAEFSSQASPSLRPLFAAIGEMAAATRDLLGPNRIAWLSRLPRSIDHGNFTLLHASPESLWRAPAFEATDEELDHTFGSLSLPVVVYAHIHRAFVRTLASRTIINSGSVSLSHDGDPRAAYLLLDDKVPTIRRVEYDLDKERKRLTQSGLPHADWIARSLVAARPQMP